MSDNSRIEWTEATWNPVTGCAKVSPGCDNCYAETLFNRFNGPGAFDTVTLRPERLAQPLRWRRPRRVFVNSMSDLFHDDVPDAYIAQVFAVMSLVPRHTFQVLTKRHGRMRSLVGSATFKEAVEQHAGAPAGVYPWPLPNVWLGVSVEDQRWADIRIPALLDTPAAVRFLSCEPLLGPIDLSEWAPPGFARWRCSGCRRFYSGVVRNICPGCQRFGYWSGSHVGNGRPNGQPLSWVIVGAESGRGARPMDEQWARSIKDQCVAAGVAFFLKQYAVNGRKVHLPELDGRTWDDYPATPASAVVA